MDLSFCAAQCPSCFQASAMEFRDHKTAACPRCLAKAPVADWIVLSRHDTAAAAGDAVRKLNPPEGTFSTARDRP